MSQHLLISAVEPVPPASSAKSTALLWTSPEDCDQRLDAKSKKSHSDRISLCGPFSSVIRSHYRE